MTGANVMDQPKSAIGPETSSEILLSKNEGRMAGKEVVRRLHSAHSSIIDCAALISDTVDRLATNRSAFESFIDVLIEGGVIAKSDARLGVNASKLSVYRKVAEYVVVLLSLRRYFDPSLYIYYDVIRLYEALDKNTDALERRLKEMALLGVSREALQQTMRDLKPSKQPLPANHLAQESSLPGSRPQISTRTGECGLVLATPSASDIRLLARDLVDSAVGTPKCMNVHEWISTTAVLLATSRIIDLPVVMQRLLPYCGFSNASHVFLLDDPAKHEITQCRALTVSFRGKYPIASAKVSEGIATGLSPFAIAVDLATEDDGRIHLFADEPSLGWTSIIGADNWSVGDAS